MATSPTAILRLRCPDQPGLVHAVTEFISKHRGNILHLDQYVDPLAAIFLMRVEWSLEDFDLGREELRTALPALAEPLGMTWDLDFSDVPLRVAIFASKAGHCLFDLLGRLQVGELNAEVPLIVANHRTHERTAAKFGVPFHHIPITADTKRVQEDAQLALLAEQNIDLVVMARYMQVLTGEFLSAHRHRVINIHHSFLPAFAGARPYHSAHERGVKLIGATAHYATEDLDEGPIISQNVVPVSHADTVADLVRKGKDVEKLVLARAVYLHCQHRVIVFGNKTVVFG